MPLRLSTVLARKLAALWPTDGDRARARLELDRYGRESHEDGGARVLLAVLKLSEGRVERLPELVDAAKADHRDVLMWAESPAEGRMLPATGRKLTATERARIAKVRKADREQYAEWLRAV